jgi:3-hydroxyisobutyrate dehydrogenase
MVWNRTRAKCADAQAHGATVAESLPELAQACDIIFICVGDTPDVEAVLFGEQALEPGLGAGKVVVDHSTICPTATVGFAARANALGVEYLDAPVSGGPPGAINATLAIMVGGEEATFERVKPYFAAMGKNLVYCGPQGSGQKVKAVNQVICALTLLATSEGLLFAKRLGLDLATVFSVVSSGAAASWMLSNQGPRILADDFAPGFTMRLQAKDLRIASELMANLGGGFPGTELTTKLFHEAVTKGIGEQGTQGLVNVLGWGE